MIQVPSSPTVHVPTITQRAFLIVIRESTSPVPVIVGVASFVRYGAVVSIATCCIVGLTGAIVSMINCV
jgi:hypothetical protein